MGGARGTCRTVGVLPGGEAAGARLARVPYDAWACGPRGGETRSRQLPRPSPDMVYARGGHMGFGSVRLPPSMRDGDVGTNRNWREVGRGLVGDVDRSIVVDDGG